MPDHISLRTSRSLCHHRRRCLPCLSHVQSNDAVLISQILSMNVSGGFRHSHESRTRFLSSIVNLLSSCWRCHSDNMTNTRLVCLSSDHDIESMFSRISHADPIPNKHPYVTSFARDKSFCKIAWKHFPIRIRFQMASNCCSTSHLKMPLLVEDRLLHRHAMPSRRRVRDVTSS